MKSRSIFLQLVALIVIFVFTPYQPLTALTLKSKANTANTTHATTTVAIAVAEEANSFNFSECGFAVYKKLRAIEEAIVVGKTIITNINTASILTTNTCAKNVNKQQKEFEGELFQIYSQYLQIAAISFTVIEKISKKQMNDIELKLKKIDAAIAVLEETEEIEETQWHKIMAEAYALQGHAYFNSAIYANFLNKIGFDLQILKSVHGALTKNKINIRATLLHLYITILNKDGQHKGYIEKQLKQLIKKNKKRIEVFYAHLLLSQIYINFYKSKKVEFHIQQAEKIYPDSPVFQHVMSKAKEIKTGL